LQALVYEVQANVAGSANAYSERCTMMRTKA